MGVVIRLAIVTVLWLSNSVTRKLSLRCVMVNKPYTITIQIQWETKFANFCPNNISMNNDYDMPLSRFLLYDAVFSFLIIIKWGLPRSRLKHIYIQ